MSNTYSVARKDKKVSRNAIISLTIGLICLLGYGLLLVASIISIGKVGVIGGFFGCLFLVLSIFGMLWSIVWYDEARTVNKFKKAAIIANALSICVGVLLIVSSVR